MHPAVQDFAQGFSPPLVAIFVIAGLGYGLVTAPATTPTTPPPAASPGPRPSSPPANDGPATAQASPSEVRALIAAGELRRARDLARDAGLAELHEEANLYASLTSTIREGAFASAERFLLGPDETPGAIRQETDEAYWIEPLEGGETAVPKAEAGRSIDREQALALLERHLRDAQRQAENGLAVHRQAFLAFRAGLKPLGVELLQAALQSREGPILVDMFAGAGGELDRLHLARDRIAGESTAPPPPLPTPRPRPTASVTTATPSPTPVAVSADPLDQEASWRRAEEAYREGLELYRSAFSASIRAGSPAVKAAMGRFRAAQDLLDPMLDKGWDGQALQRIERRLMELNSLVLDCTKRLGTGD